MGFADVDEQVGEEGGPVALVRSLAWSRWRVRIVTNWCPVSKKPQRSQIDS